MHPPTLRAALAIIYAQDATSGMRNLENVAIGEQGDFVLVERKCNDGSIEAVVYDTTNGSFRAAVFSDPNDTSNPSVYSLGTARGAKDGTSLLVAAIYHGLGNASDEELGICIRAILDHVVGTTPLDDDSLSQYGVLLCDNIYTRIVSADSLGEVGIKTSLPSTSNVQPLTRLAIEQATYAPEVVFSGEFKVFKVDVAKHSECEVVSNGDLRGRFAFSERFQTTQTTQGVSEIQGGQTTQGNRGIREDSEQDLIPHVPEWYVVPKEVIRIAQHAQMTTGSNQPMRNFMLRGVAGGGKTEGAKAIAAAVALPYLSITCSANTEIFDLLGQMLPDVEGMSGDVGGNEGAKNNFINDEVNSFSGSADGAGGIYFNNSNDSKEVVANVGVSGFCSSRAKLPTLEDIQMDTATAYFMLTGIYDENIGADEVYNKLLEVARGLVIAELRSGGGSNGGDGDVSGGRADHTHLGISDNARTELASQKFRYVETPLVKAMKYGYLIEIQEPSVIANPGVLVGLNSLLDNCKQITLPTGETIWRHPDTIVVVTTNSDYSGCRDMNQSVISRMNLIMDIGEPSQEDLVSRVSAITGFNDEEVLTLMASVVKDIQTHCRETMITDGCCGVRELIAWVQSYMVTGNLAESAEYTILSSTSACPESRESVRNTCIMPKMAT